MYPLSTRQRQILDLMLSGKRPAEISSDLSISVKTYSAHRCRILTKAKVRTDTQLGAWAMLQRFAAP